MAPYVENNGRTSATVAVAGKFDTLTQLPVGDDGDDADGAVVEVDGDGSDTDGCNGDTTDGG